MRKICGRFIEHASQSKALLEAVGFEKEAIWRDYFYQKGRRWDFHVYGLLKNDFEIFLKTPKGQRYLTASQKRSEKKDLKLLTLPKKIRRDKNEKTTYPHAPFVPAAHFGRLRRGAPGFRIKGTEYLCGGGDDLHDEFFDRGRNRLVLLVPGKGKKSKSLGMVHRGVCFRSPCVGHPCVS